MQFPNLDTRLRSSNSPRGVGPIRRVDAVSQRDIDDLARGNVLVLRAPLFSPAEAEVLAQRIVERPGMSQYRVAPIGFHGDAMYDSNGDAAKRRAYFAAAAQTDAAVSEIFAGVTHPLHVMQDILRRSGPGPVEPQTVDGHPMTTGILRYFDVGSEALPHQDVFEWDAPGAPETASMHTRLSQIVYLRTAAAGGELVLWRTGLTEPEEYEALRLPGSYGLDERRLERPAAVVRPAAGEMLLFDAQRVHAVRPILAGTRVTASYFVHLHTHGGVGIGS